MRSDPVIALIRVFADEFDRRGWRDPGDAAQTLAHAVAARRSSSAAVDGVQKRFLIQNGISAQDLVEVVAKVQSDVEASRSTGSAPASLEGTGPSEGTGEVLERPSHPRRAVVLLRWLIAVLVVGATSIAAIYLPGYVGWTWLLDHPNGLAIRALAVVGAVGLGLTIATARKEIAVVVLVPAVIALLALLGK